MLDTDWRHINVHLHDRCYMMFSYTCTVALLQARGGNKSKDNFILVVIQHLPVRISLKFLYLPAFIFIYELFDIGLLYTGLSIERSGVQILARAEILFKISALPASLQCRLYTVGGKDETARRGDYPPALICTEATLLTLYTHSCLRAGSSILINTM